MADFALHPSAPLASSDKESRKHHQSNEGNIMSNINPVTEASVEATPLPPQPKVVNPVGTAAPMLPVEDKPLNLGGHEFESRFILGSGRYDLNLIKATVEHAGTQIVTMALRRAQTTENSVLDYIPEGITLLPNTSGARNAEEAVRIARLAREVCHTDFDAPIYCQMVESVVSSGW
ncbi:hypothetical protein BW12_00650 [Bifidobacterium sp. UTCIF-3]|nr:hypothetical protein BW09_00350 [Bifidobacterium sp. UTCIF-1]TPF83226.1 hypothetical protein BW12_00650 [Bifidobacterium sp. UTCIF-3]TPF85013.1 hypothetical protein BW07_01710 [Bifidobacterium sp. UTCIF-36]